MELEHGAQQGSVLGLILFLLYINDLPLNIMGSKIVLFVENTRRQPYFLFFFLYERRLHPEFSSLSLRHFHPSLAVEFNDQTACKAGCLNLHSERYIIFIL
jgi:hypothetical protein